MSAESENYFPRNLLPLHGFARGPVSKIKSPAREMIERIVPSAAKMVPQKQFMAWFSLSSRTSMLEGAKMHFKFV